MNTKTKRVTTINTRLRAACIAEAKANLSGATRALREGDTETATTMIDRASESIVRADGYADADAEPSA